MGKTISSFLSVCRCILSIQRVNNEVFLYRENQNLSQKEYDKEQIYKETNELYNAYADASKALIENFKKHIQKDLLYYLIESLTDEDVCEEKLGECICVSVNKIYEKAPLMLDYFIEKLSKLEEDVEDQVFFWDGVKDLFLEQSKQTNKASDFICPHCSSNVSIVSSADFFDESPSIPNENDVAICQCGAYAFVDKDGQMIGSMADKETHDKRSKIYFAISTSRKTFGLLSYEVRKVFQQIVKKPLNNWTDIEFLSKEECNKILHSFMLSREKLDNLTIKWPQSHKELITALKKGYRVRILSSISPDKNTGRLLIPAVVNDGCIIVNKKEKQEKFLFPSVLDYKFDKDIVTIRHPSGLEDKFCLYPPEYKKVFCSN